MTSRLTTRSGRRVELNLPESSFDELETARAELKRLSKQRLETEDRRRELLTARESAKRSDLELAARAIRAGKKEPTTRAVDAVDEELAKLEEHLSAVDTALDMCEGELIAAVEQRRDERVGELDSQVAAAQDAWRETIAAAEALLAKINRLSSLRAWFRTFPAGPHPAFRTSSFGHLNLRDGTGSPAAALEALHAAFDLQATPDRHVMPVPPDGPKPLASRVA